MILVVVAASAVTATPAMAQDSTGCGCVILREPHTPNTFERHSAGAFSVIQSRGRGTFGDNVGYGYGLNAAYLYGIDDRGILSLRADAGFLQYGEESKHVPLSTTIGGRIQVKVSTSNYIVPLMIGPQLTWPSGTVRPYVNGGIGGQFFFTESSVEGSDDSFDFANTTNQWDKTLAWIAGGGVYVPVYEGKTKVMLDLGAQYVKGGTARYLRPGSIEDLPDAQIRITPMESETHMLVVRIGVKVGL